MPGQYSHERQGYLEWYSHLLTPPDVEPGQSALEMLEYRLDGFNLEAEELITATKDYLEHHNPLLRAAALDSLLHQVEGDLAVVNLVWEIIAQAQTLSGDDLNLMVGQMIKNSRLPITYRHLALELTPTLEQRALLFGDLQPVQETDSIAAALDDLRFEIDQAIDLIKHDTNRVSLRLIRSILCYSETEWGEVQAGIEILRGRQGAGDIGWGFEDRVNVETSGLAAELRSTLVNIVERILLIIEKNDLVRYTIADWLEELHDLPANARTPKMQQLLEHLYQVEKFQNKHLAVWLHDAHDIARVQKTSAAIQKLSDNFERLASLIRRLDQLTDVSVIFRNPVLASAGYAIEVGLLGIIAFAGYDHLDEGSVALNMTRGIKEILLQELPVSAETLFATEYR